MCLCVYICIHVHTGAPPGPSCNPGPCYLLSHLGLRPQLQQTPCKGCCSLEILELEEEVEGCAQYQYHMHRLQVGVCEVGGHLRWGRTDRALNAAGRHGWGSTWGTAAQGPSGARATHLTNAFLLLNRVLGQLLSFNLHGQAHNVLAADGNELLSLCGKQRGDERLGLWQTGGQ